MHAGLDVAPQKNRIHDATCWISQLPKGKYAGSTEWVDYIIDCCRASLQEILGTRQNEMEPDN